MPLHWPFAVRTFPHDAPQLTYPMGDYCTPRLPSSTPQLSESIRLTVTASVRPACGCALHVVESSCGLHQRHELLLVDPLVPVRVVVLEICSSERGGEGGREEGARQRAESGWETCIVSLTALHGAHEESTPPRTARRAATGTRGGEEEGA